MRYLAVAQNGTTTTNPPLAYSQFDGASPPVRVGQVGPTVYARALDFSANGRFLVMARGPHYDLYRRDGNSFVGLPRAAGNLSATGVGAAFHSDNSHLALYFSGGVRAYAFKVTSDTTWAYDSGWYAARPGADPYLNSPTWGGDYVAMALGFNPYLYVSKLTGDTYSKVADPTSTAFHTAPKPTAACYAVAWSPDAAYLAITSNSGGALQVYSRVGDVLTRLADPPSPGGLSYAAAFSPDGTRFVCGWSTSAIRYYHHDGAGGLTLPTVSSYPLSAGRIQALAWSADGTTLAVGTTTTPFLQLYSHDGDTLTAMDPVAEPPADAVTSLSWTPDYPPVSFSGTALLTTSAPPATFSAAPATPPVEFTGTALLTTSALPATLSIAGRIEFTGTATLATSSPSPLLSRTRPLSGTATAATNSTGLLSRLRRLPPGVSVLSTSTLPATLGITPTLPGLVFLSGTALLATSAPSSPPLTRTRGLSGLATLLTELPPAPLSRLRPLSGTGALTTSAPPARMSATAFLERDTSGLDPQFLALMPHRILVERKSGQDRYGRETYSPPTTWPARIRYTQRIMRTPDGEEIVSQGQVTIGGISGVTSDDRITLPAPGQLVATSPDADETFSPLIVSVHRASDEDGDYFERVTFA